MQKRNVTDLARENAESFRLKMEGLSGAFKSERVRWLIGRENEIKKNSKMSDEAFTELFSKTVKEEAERSIIVAELKKEKERTITEIASSTKMPSKLVLRHILALLKSGHVAIAGEREGEYLFTAQEPP
jgi:DNA-binding transcriptional ArsR family regulator